MSMYCLTCRCLAAELPAEESSSAISLSVPGEKDWVEIRISDGIGYMFKALGERA